MRFLVNLLLANTVDSNKGQRPYWIMVFETRTCLGTVIS